MLPPPPISTLFPYTTLFRSLQVVISELEHRGYESAARCLAEDLDALVAHRSKAAMTDRKSTRLNSSHPSISYAVFCLKKKIESRPTQCAGRICRRTRGPRGP